MPKERCNGCRTGKSTTFVRYSPENWCEKDQTDCEVCAIYELKEDSFYDVLADYPDCVIEYCVIKSEEPYWGESSHREALAFAMRRMAEAYVGDDPIWTFDIRAAAANETEAAAFFSLPKQMQNANPAEKKSHSIPYWQAFLMPPHKNSYTEDDFVRINSALFPKGTDDLALYEWSTDWTDYFEDGREWWGTFCVTVYDKALARFIVMMASATD